MSRLEAFLKDALESASPEARAGAWGELSQLLRAFVRASMSSRSRAIEESMDVVNSVVKSFIGEIQEGKLRFEGEEQLKGYLRRVVRHKLVDHDRRRGALRRGGGAPLSPLDTAAGALVKDEGNGVPSATARGRELRDQIREILRGEERGIWDLYCEKRGWPEIGNHLGVSADAARKRVARIREKLRQKLDLGEE